MLPELQVSDLARNDLDDIWRCGFVAWGSAQAERYGGRLLAALDGLCHNPLKGPARDDLMPGLRHLAAGRHLIFYRVERDAILILRVLDGSRDAPSSLLAGSGPG